MEGRNTLLDMAALTQFQQPIKETWGPIFLLLVHFAVLNDGVKDISHFPGLLLNQPHDI